MSIGISLFFYFKNDERNDKFQGECISNFLRLHDKLDSVLVKAKSVDPDEKWNNLKSAFSAGRPNERS